MKLKTITLGLLLTVALTLTTSSQQSSRACALPACDLERLFYSDKSFTTQVGSKHVTCQGIVQWGSQTNHFEHLEYGDCGHGAGTCGGVDYGCSSGIIVWASDPQYVGQPCATYVP